MAVSTSSDSVESVFKEYVDHLQKDHEIRDVVRETLRNLEQSSRELSAIIQKIHTPGSIKNCKLFPSLF